MERDFCRSDRRSADGHPGRTVVCRDGKPEVSPAPSHTAYSVITHFLSPNPDESGVARATWQHSKDTSTIWAVAIASSSDLKYVAPGAIPWLLLRVVGDQPGPTGSDQLVKTTHIQRLNTSGGVAPSTGCSRSTDVGAKALVHYTAKYVFYTGGISRRGRR